MLHISTLLNAPTPTAPLLPTGSAIAGNPYAKCGICGVIFDLVIGGKGGVVHSCEVKRS